MMAVDERPKTTALIKMRLMAPCGMNCALCMAFLRDRKPCPGCNGGDERKPKHCVNCGIKNCPELAGAKYCYKCGKFPCVRLKRLDKSYRAKYGMSMIANLEAINDLGIREFTRCEKERWACPKCGALICVHHDACGSCGHVWKNDLKK